MGQGARAARNHGGWHRWTEGEARAALTELARSGESAAEFARSRGFSTQRIHYWKKRLGAPSAVPAFVPVRWPVGAPSTIASATIEIVSSGVTVRVREDLDVLRDHDRRLRLRGDHRERWELRPDGRPCLGEPAAGRSDRIRPGYRAPRSLPAA